MTARVVRCRGWRQSWLALALGVVSAVVGAGAWAQLPASTSVAAPAASAVQPAGLLFAVEIRTGPAWDSAKAPQEQLYFREHSTHLRRLREQGALVMGARYGDKGLIVLRAASEAEAHAWLKDDPSMQAGTFRYDLHEFRVFYSGTLVAPPRPR